MNNSKLVQVFSTFSSKEWNEFLDFANSPFFNKNKKVLLLLKYIHQAQKNHDSFILESEQVFKKAYPEKKFDQVYLNKQISILYQLQKKYLVYLDRIDSSIDQDLAFLRQLEKRKLDNIFHLQKKAIKKNHFENAIQDGQGYFQKYQLKSIEDTHFTSLQLRRYDHALQEKMDNLDIYYLIEKLKGSCEMLNRGKIVEGNYQFNLLKEIITFFENKNPHSQIPILEIYLQIFKTLQNEGEELHFEKLVELLAQHQNSFPQKEAIGMYRYAQNYCIRKINQGQKEYFRKLFELFQTQLTHQINMPNGILSAADYKNIVTVGLQVKEAEWVKQFIFDYKSALKPDLRENVFNYNLASFHYGVKDYDAAIKLLSTVKYTDIYYEISGKIILAKTYFTLGENETLNYFIDAYKLNLLRNKKIAFQYRQSIINFLIQLKKITKLKDEFPYMDKTVFQKKKEKIQLRLEKVEPIIDRRWLLNSLSS